MKKLTFLCLGTLMVAGGLLVSCQKKECEPGRGKCAPHHSETPPKPTKPTKPPESPCKKY